MSPQTTCQGGMALLECWFLGSGPALLRQTLGGWGLGISIVAGSLGFWCTPRSDTLDKAEAERVCATGMYSPPQDTPASLPWSGPGTQGEEEVAGPVGSVGCEGKVFCARSCLQAAGR